MADSRLTPAPEFFELQRALTGRYSLVRELGRGGMGIVFLARDLSLERLVAIKLLPPSLTRDPARRERFLREARLAAQLAHPHIVPIHDVAVTSELAYFVMGYIDGESLGSRVRARGPMAVGDVVRVVQEVAWALAHAHAHGIIHRDIKPDNILLERGTGRALVTDFGIARGDGGPTPADGVLEGTPQYMSPEQLRGEPGDAQSDLFALGVTAWFALSGRHPVEAASVTGLLTRQAQEPLPAIHTAVPAIPAGLGALIDRTLAPLAVDRPRSAEAVAIALDDARTRFPQVPPPVRDFIRSAMAAGDDIQSALVGVGSSALLLAIAGKVAGGAGTGFLAGINDLFAGLTVLTLGLVFAGLGFVRFGGLFLASRELVREGYDITDVRSALLGGETDAIEGLTTELRRERRRRAWWYGLTTAAKTAIALWLAMLDRPAWIYLPAAVMAVLLPAYGVRTITNLTREGPSRWSKMLRGWLGTWLFRGARLFQGKGLPPGRPIPTVFALAQDVDDCIRALPAAAHAQLDGLTARVRQLQTEATALGTRREEQDAQRRLQQIALELDAMRLELLVLRADGNIPEDVTRQIERARNLGDRVERALRPSPVPEKARTPV
jgi:serine/threonine-protein kinase